MRGRATPTGVIGTAGSSIMVAAGQNGPVVILLTKSTDIAQAVPAGR